jgi:hypothetical protein
MARPVKYRWADGCGNKITAGGVLVYDDQGVWVALERRWGRTELTDIGGKCECTDCDIFFTIAREFCEETYHMAAITRQDVMNFAAVPGALAYVTNNRGRPVYASLSVHVDDLRRCGVEMSPETFNQNRELALQSNPTVPAEVYSTVALRYLPWAALNTVEAPILGNRLRQALAGPLIEAARKKGEVLPQARARCPVRAPPSVPE